MSTASQNQTLGPSLTGWKRLLARPHCRRSLSSYLAGCLSLQWRWRGTGGGIRDSTEAENRERVAAILAADAIDHFRLMATDGSKTFVSPERAEVPLTSKPPETTSAWWTRRVHQPSAFEQWQSNADQLPGPQCSCGQHRGAFRHDRRDRPK